MDIQYIFGLPEDQRDNAAQLYDEAFGPKLPPQIGDRAQRVAILTDSLVAECAVCALADGEIVGLAGFTSKGASLTSGINYRGLLSHLGFLRGNWASLILSLYEREPASGQLLMDGITVRHELRGHGIGRRLLDEVSRYAVQHGYESVRLDVIDTNPAARRLYERVGFQAVNTERFEYLRWLIGFGAATTMELDLSDLRAALTP